MINLADRTITLKGKTTTIEDFAVWFRTPFGLHASLDTALAAVREGDLDPKHTVVPVAVAVGADGTTYEEMPR